MTRVLRILFLVCFFAALAGCAVPAPAAAPTPTAPLPTVTPQPTPTARSLRLDDFRALKIGMTWEEVVALVGEPDRQVAGSSGFATYAYVLKTGETVYTYFYIQANYLENVDYQDSTGEWLGFPRQYIHEPPPKPRELRALWLADFENIHVGMRYYEAYMYVGPYDTYVYFEDGVFAMLYYLEDGGRVGLNVLDSIAGCIDRIGYSPDPSGSNWMVLEEDTDGVCE